MAEAGAQGGAGDAGGGAGAGAGGEGGAAPWFAGIQDADLRGFAETRGWTGVDQVVESYRNAEKMLGVPKDKLLRIPEGNDPAQQAEFYAKLGRPEKPDGYKVPDAYKQDAVVGGFRDTAHALGLSDKQFEGALDWYTKTVTGFQQQEQQRAEQQAEADLATLRDEWGMAFDQRIEMGRRVARTFGVDEATMTKMEAAMGTAAFMRHFAGIGEKLGEDNFVDSGGAAGSRILSPEGAKARITELKNDKGWFDKFIAGDVEAKAEWDRLHVMAYPGTTESGPVPGMNPKEK
ncbi:MAG: hypothetical protein KIT73_01255 [Burkholderiales bacterium]|nr:hypothetical protein [Burkholderiales bacterium]